MNNYLVNLTYLFQRARLKVYLSIVLAKELDYHWLNYWPFLWYVINCLVDNFISFFLFESLNIVVIRPGVVTEWELIKVLPTRRDRI